MPTHYETADLIRIATGHITKSAILSSSDYLVSNFTTQSDSKSPYWLAYIDGAMSNGTIVQSISGNGGLYGKYSGTITLAVFSPDMLQYFFDTVMNGQYIAPVTLYCFHPRYKEVAIQCYLKWFDNIANNGTQQTDTDYTNVVMTWNRGVITGNAYTSAYSSAYE